MTVAEIMEQAKTLSAQERKELVKQLVDTLKENQKAAKAKSKRIVVDVLAKPKNQVV